MAAFRGDILRVLRDLWTRAASELAVSSEERRIVTLRGSIFSELIRTAQTAQIFAMQFASSHDVSETILMHVSGYKINFLFTYY